MPEESVKLCNMDFNCRICCNLLREPYIIPCGHSFCYDCIKDCNKCPVCKDVPHHQLIPNKILGEIVEKFKKEQEINNKDGFHNTEELLKQIQKIESSNVRFLLLN